MKCGVAFAIFKRTAKGEIMFIFFLVIAIFVLVGLIVFMMIELNTVEQAGIWFLSEMKKRYGEK